MKTKILAGLLCALTFTACPAIEEPIEEVKNTCAVPTGEPIVHDGAITADETWTADSPHLVKYTVRIDQGATLTIAPCAVVRLQPGASIIAGVGGSVPTEGHLVAEGTASNPITFERVGTEPWGGLIAQWPGTVKLAHVELSGGGDNSSWDNATLVAQGDGEPVPRRNLRVKNVTVRDSYGHGAYAGYAGAFMEGSENLTVTSSGFGDAQSPYPLTVGTPALGTVPSGRYTGNAIDEISVGYGQLAADTTVKKVGVPYRLVGIPGSTLTVADTVNRSLRVLTIEPGVVFKFEPGTHLRVGVGSSGTINYPGALVAVGTAAEPVVFTSANAQPAAGDWRGIAFDGNNEVNRLENVRIEYAGGECSCVLATCATPDTPDEYAIWLQETGDASFRDFIHGVTIFQSGNHGIVCSYDSDSMCPDFTDDNVFEGIAGCRQIVNRDSTGRCVARPACL